MKERIDHTNYEAWLLDRLEGNLSDEQSAMLDAFMAANPGLDPGMDELPSLAQCDQRLNAAHKDALKRTLPPTGLPDEPIDDHLVAKFEGDLTVEQEQALRVYLIDHPEHQRSERLYELARLLPEALAYADKKILERQLPPQGLLNHYTVEDHLVARLEKDLTQEQERALDEYLLTDDQAQRTWAILQHTRIPMDALVYEHKQDLKKGGKVIAIGAATTPWALRLRVAASIAVILGLAIWAFDRSAGVGPQVAEQPQEQVPWTTIDSTLENGRSEEIGSDPVETQQPDGSRSAPTKLREKSQQDERSVPEPLGRSVKNAPPFVPEPGAVDRLVGVVPQLPAEPPAQDATLEVPVPVLNTLLAAASNERPKAQVRQGIPLGEFIANVFRKQVLDPASDEEGPLGQADAVAALDKGLRTVGGDRAGLDVERQADGRVRRFDLRLGRNFAISASR